MKDKKNLLIVLLCIAVAALSIAYAAFSTSLKINASGAITSTWGKIYITDCSCAVTGAGVTTEAPTATCTPVDNTTNTVVTGAITFNAKTPGDQAVCTFTVKNDGTLIADAPTFSVTSSSNFTIEGSSGTCLKAGGTGTFVATVTYNSSVTEAPTTVETQMLTATYTQGTTCA